MENFNIDFELKKVCSFDDFDELMELRFPTSFEFKKHQENIKQEKKKKLQEPIEMVRTKW